eukprot:CAMPEP_0118645272 /NCGR_PEP_ID=MMETSP0785-20121206/7409_1 /TAXON_ID=91992 /ORGANISM="Bolidomonas pacifica, Strain CCMP 1866" /LENGTH=384 /DNA_ID=CAMNT_0006537137 /DNA_START=223 /DNA_END=1374 /DNA_ORIENTATION=+
MSLGASAVPHSSLSDISSSIPPTSIPASNESQLNQVRATFLFFYTCLGSLLPYLPVYYHSLGLSGPWIGVLGAVNPMTTFIVGPVWGAIADKYNAHKNILLVTLVTSILARLSMLLSDSPYYLVFSVFLTAVLNAPVKPLMDSSVMHMLPNKESYGRMRLWGQLGFGLGSSGVGLLLSRSKLGYKFAFLVHGLLMVPTALIMQQFKINNGSDSSEEAKTSPSSGVTPTVRQSPKFKEGLRVLSKNMDAMIFFALVFIVGVSSGCIENFAYVRMREVGGTGRDMGISRFVSASGGVPMFWFAGQLTRGLGVSKILVGTLASYTCRFFIYANMKKPLYGLPAEALRGATFALFWSTATIYAHKIAPPGMSATLLAIMNGMYGGLGQ